MMKVLVYMVLIVSWTTISSAEDDTSIEPRIVGGYETTIANHKYIIQLRYQGSWICGGSLVSSRHVVTASHCVEFDPTPSAFSIKAGVTRISAAGTTRQVIRIWMHPKFNSATIDYDIAVLKLWSDISGPLIASIPLATSRLKAGQFAKVAGWGRTTEGGTTSNVLRAVYVPVVSNARCNVDYGAGSITNRMMCAGVSGKDACQGDSGGPLTKSGKLYGVVSFGEGCARAGYPGVYTNVVFFRAFINAKIKL